MAVNIGISYNQIKNVDEWRLSVDERYLIIENHYNLTFLTRQNIALNNAFRYVLSVRGSCITPLENTKVEISPYIHLIKKKDYSES